MRGVPIGAHGCRCESGRSADSVLSGPPAEGNRRDRLAEYGFLKKDCPGPPEMADVVGKDAAASGLPGGDEIVVPVCPLLVYHPAMSRSVVSVPWWTRLPSVASLFRVNAGFN